jgi:glycosyltransferase involved in cell wall biosynthesis
MNEVCFISLAGLPALSEIYSDYECGGAELQQVLIAKALKNKGWTVSMIVSDYGQPDIFDVDGITCYKLKSTVKIPVFGTYLVLFPRFFKLIKQINADIYHVSSAGVLLGFTALFSRFNSKKLIYRVASDTDCSWGNLLIKRWVDKACYWQGLKYADQIHTQNSIQDKLIERLNLPFMRMLSLVEPPQQVVPILERTLSVIWVGNFRHVKRVDRVAFLAELMPNVDFHVIGGEGSTGIVPEELISNSPKNVKYHGRKNRIEACMSISDAKLLINTSEFEGVPNTYLQAWLHGVPVITLNDPNEMIVNNELGCVVDIDDMSEAIAQLLNDDTALERISEKVKQYASSHYLDESTLQGYDAIFRGLR